MTVPPNPKRYYAEYKPTITDVEITSFVARIHFPNYSRCYEAWIYLITHNNCLYAVVTDGTAYGVDELDRVCGWCMDDLEMFKRFATVLINARTEESCSTAKVRKLVGDNNSSLFDRRLFLGENT